ncbi:MAG: phosphoribosylglycinamide formyltransferase [Gammaproteobacteria bacterium]|nr:phosphoribosylglycinamide formyltransferase [Gammaproteobacteria bacterium]MBT3488624.1 phosphoribosylglycinamide formyltransferase [Gammaproteobacteria bacterium]MBT3718271.1 phosphoribosylglycinamide formyltransferase [Gammaproteobacteria bacterium]MBT3846131.1 phosphoribosylglycinamide formyltransferase [Gammaproteobacteria bacterium]MBT3893159.1 phosphoribosylglycinamide formyltransferase [Gammaproteobacteria bacterium]
MTQPSPIKIVVLISGRGSNLQSLFHAQQAEQLNVEFAAVISNRPQAAGLQFAQQQQLATTVVDHTRYSGRESYDQSLIEAIDSHHPQLVVLAGFMRILTPQFVRHYAGRLINIHPSLLPNFKGLHTHQQALDAGVEQHGASVHFVTEELDGGPVFLQATVAVEADDTAEVLAARVLHQEHQLYPAAVQLIAEGRIALVDGRLYFDDTVLYEPIQLGG